MSTASVLLLVLTSLFVGAALASLADSIVLKRKGEGHEKKASIRLTLFFLFSSGIIVTLSCLVIFTPFLAEYEDYTGGDYIYLLVWLGAGFSSVLWYKTALPLFISLYVIVFLAFAYYLDETCLSYTSPVMITFEKNAVMLDGSSVPFIQSIDGSSDSSAQKTGYLVVQEYVVPPKMLFPVQRTYFRLVLFSDNRIVQDDFAQDFFSPLQEDEHSFFAMTRNLVKFLYRTLGVDSSGKRAVFYFVEVQLAEFYPYVFSFQPVKSSEGFTYILDKIL